ncbi:MAG: hypothetical protein IPO21_18155 [Bacteroidales bacterium]|nr:hypothetical protein [Bacteroidales bacterium]
MRNFLLTILVLLSITSVAQDESKFNFGVKVMLGGRYDNVRMCVASKAGVPGGMVADVMLLVRYQLQDNLHLTLEVPVMRPILFAAAFKMLQFEPQITLDYSKELNNGDFIVAGLGLGTSFHYGPDYLSDQKNRNQSFFAIGPEFSALVAYRFSNDEGTPRIIGLRPFYIPLFSKEPGYEKGTVLGGVVDFGYYF